MKRTHQFWIIGGDHRQEKLARLLWEDGHDVHTYALEQSDLPRQVVKEESLTGLPAADCVILPLPVTQESPYLNAPLSAYRCPLPALIPHLTPKQPLLGGLVTPWLRETLGQSGLTIQDYFLREELAVANAVPTAEGAVAIAMQELAVTLHGARVLVLGYGRVGKLTAHRFAALGSCVTVAARRFEALAWAEAYGHQTLALTELSGYLCGFDVVINTIPTPILTRELLEDLKPDCLVIDLASKPGGVDLFAATDLGVRVVWALSLPGKVAPASAAKALKNTIYNMLRENEEQNPPDE